LAWAIPFLFCGLAKAESILPSLIEVQVEVTEVDHRKASQLGIEWMDKIRIQENTRTGFVALGSHFWRTPLKADIHFMIEEGAAELLANPNLITDSGTTAVFHAGGEIPYVTTSSLGSSNVEFKPYGVRLKIKPRLTKEGTIKMSLEASVSSPDETNGVVLSGNTVPALLQRDVKSHVTLNPGQTMTLAGLVQTVKEESTRGIPFLRRIPLLGFLFRWKRSSFRKTTIVIFVTPKLVHL